MFRNHALSGALAFLCTILSASAPQPVNARDLISTRNLVLVATQQAVWIPPSVPQITQAINPLQLLPMQTGVPAGATPANDLGAVADDYQLNQMFLLLHRPDEQEQALAEFMTEQTTIGSVNFHNWLTAEQVGQFGPNPSDIDTITGWLQTQGFVVNRVSGDQMMVDFSGTAGQVRDAFSTEIHNLNVDGEAHISNMSVPQIPAALAPAVTGIVSLNDFKPHTNFKPRTEYTYTSGASTFHAIVPADLATIYNLNPAFTAGIDGTGQTIVLLEEGNPFNSSGGVNADINKFRSTFGLPAFAAGGPTYTEVHPGSCTDPGVINGVDGEVNLDIEWAGAAAPHANLVMASCADSTTYGVITAMTNLNTLNDSARLWSLSYGLCEASNGATFNAAFSNAYQTAAARGVSVFVSSGDEGAASCDANQTKATHGIGVSGWTSTPYNVSVGGTDYGDTFAGTTATYWNTTNTATFGSAKSYIPEIPWNDSCASVLISTKSGFATPYGSTGFCNSSTATTNNAYLTTGSGSGGPSGCFTGTASTTKVVSGTCAGGAKPAWQVGLLGNPSDGVRDIPDISLFAANGVWGHYFVYCYTRTTANSGGAPCTGAPSTWSGAGGTSFSSPIMAGIQALVNQKTSSAQGNPNPIYYQLARNEYGTTGSSSCNSSNGNTVGSTCVFYDVTQGDLDVNCTGTINCYLPSGTNGVLSTSSASYLPAYGTNVGWDFSTGIGTVNAANLVNSWPTLGAANKLAFTAQPNASYVSGAAITVAVSIEDSAGNVLSLAPNTSVTLALTTPGGATLSGTKTRTTASGGAAFPALSVDKSGTYTLTATGSGLTSGVSSSFVINPGAATKLIFTTQPANGTVGATLAAVGVSVEDAASNVVTTDTSSVTLAFAANPGAATLGGTLSKNATAGVATFSNLTVNQVATGYTLIATDGSLTSATSSAFNIGKGSQTITITSTAPAATVGGATYTPTATSTSGLSVTFTIDASSTAGACSISAGVVSFTGAGSCILDANQAGNASYNAATQVQQTVTVGKAAQTITITSTAPAATVGGATYTPTATSTSGLAVTFTIDASSTAGACSISGGVVSFTGAGSCIIDANQAGNANYNAATQVQQTVTVGKGSQTITITSTAPAATVGGSTYTPTATSTSGLTVTITIDASSTAGACTISGGVVSFTGAGSCVIDANQAGNANYNAATQKQQTVTVGKGSQTITITSTAPAATVGGATYTPTATSTSGLAVTFTIDASSTAGACTISGGVVSFTGAGSCVIDANQAGNANYNAATQVQQTVTVGKAAQTVTITSTAPSAMVGGATYTPTATSTSGLVVTITIDASSTAGACTISGGVVSFTGAGSCVIDANQAGNANYNAATQVQQTVTVGKASQTVTITSTAPGATVGATYTPTATSSSGLSVTFTIDASSTAGACTISGGVVSFTGAGSCVIDANQAGNANYNAATQVQQTVTVGKGSQTITITSTAPAATVGGATYTPTATSTSGLVVTITIDASSTAGACTISGGVVSFTGAGSCVIDANQAGNANYNAATQVQQTVTVGKASQTVTITSTAPTATVGGATYTPTATSTSGLVVTITIDASSTAGACTISGGVVSFTGAGSCVIDANQAGNANYNAATQVQQTVTVGKASQTVTITSTAPAATVGGATYTPTATSTSGLVVTFTIDASSTAGACTISGGVVSFTGAGSCVIDANQAGNANYNAATQVQQIVTVGKASQTVTITSTAPAATVGGPSYTVTATATSGFAVTFTIDASAILVCSISGSTVSFIGVGTCVIDANQAGDANYNAAPQVQQSFGVGLGAGTQLVFTTQPANLLAGTTTSTTVSVEDAFGNVITADNTTQVSISVNACGTTTLGTLTVSNGVAQFSDLRLYTVASGLQLHAIASPVLASADSSTFAVQANTDVLFENGFDTCTP